VKYRGSEKRENWGREERDKKLTFEISNNTPLGLPFHNNLYIVS
jgi:hypothetical protein